MNDEGRLAELMRRDFDAGFAARPVVHEPRESFLAIRVGDRPFAIRLGEIRLLALCRRLVRLPGPWPELLGLSGVRGEAVPVYDLAALLGEAPTRTPPHWLALCVGDEPVAVGFQVFEAYVRVARGELFAPDPSDGARAGVVQVARTRGAHYSVIGLAELSRSLRQRAAAFAADRKRNNP